MTVTDEPLAEEAPPRRRRRRLITLALIAVLLLAFFVPPLVSLGRYRRSISSSISAALGRPVQVGAIALRLLPMPGITLDGFTVEEDPAFGYEPVLHANSVVVSLRISSLWRRRLEISRISLDEASLNLVRNSAGQWNIGSVLLHASQIPNAPTAQRHPGPTPRFPYIEASDSRIDFKDGAEKKPFSLMNAEFSMWQAGNGEWRLRLKAQPVRTDLELHLSDAGQLRVEGSLLRAADIRAMPVNLQAEWSGAQLGQASQLLTGFDSGWRGDLDVAADIRGTPVDLDLRSHIVVDNLRRQEFQPVSTLDVDTTCSAHYLRPARTLGNITCFLPVSPGHLLLTGSVQAGTPPHADLQLEINQVPVSFPLTLLGRMRPNAQNVSATGAINGNFRLVAAERRTLTGGAEASQVSLSGSGGTLTLPALRFLTSTPPAKHRRAPIPPQQNAILLQPFAIPFGEPQPLIVDARLTRAGFALHLDGPASLSRIAAPGATLGLLGRPLSALGAKGRVELNTTTAANWLPSLNGGSSGLATTGSIHVQGAELHPAFLHAPLDVDSADLNLGSEQISWQNAAIRWNGIAMHGSLQFPAVCDQSTPCPSAFTLQAPSLSASAIESALASEQRGFFGQIIADALGGNRSSAWPPLHGSIQCNALTLDHLLLHNATASVSVSGNRFEIRSLDASAFGGSLHGSGALTVDAGIPRWNLDLRLTSAKPAQIAALFHERWGAGTINGNAKLSMTGLTTASLVSTTAGNFYFNWQNGALAHVAASSTPLAHFARWTASGSIVNNSAKVTGILTRAGRPIPMHGTIGFDRHLDLILPGTHIGGTLAHPVVVAAH